MREMTSNNNLMNKISLTERGVCIGGKYEVLLCGSLFYFRLPRAVWKDRIAKLKRAGYNCVDVYFPWNYHELESGEFDFEGERDVRFFLEELSRAGLYVIARPGPYICSEWNGGAIPARILESDMPIRCADEKFLAEVEKWYRAIFREITPFAYGKGGSVILIQLENELDFFDCPAPEAYIARLLEMARKSCTDIPYFCCAGQFDVARAGGLTRGVEATLNCYPDSLDPTFDSELYGYALRFAERGKPLLVSETNRDHFLLRRELSCGAKLLGAYNQVAGINFDHNQAVNNWGTPDAFITTEYDFESMIDVAGGFHEEAQNGALFSAFLSTVGQALAGALPAKEAVAPKSCSFTTVTGGLRVLELEGGGAAVCVPNFSERGEIEFTYHGHTVKAEVPSASAPFFLFDFDLSPLGIPAVLTHANCEPIFAEKGELVFYSTGAPEVGLDFGTGEQLVTGDTIVNGVKVRFLDRTQALALVAGGLSCADYQAKPFKDFGGAQLPAWRSLPVGDKTHFGALGVTEGTVEYEVSIPAGKSLFIEHPCDIMQITADGKRGETLFADGRDVIVPPAASGNYTVSIEKWGHSNFDDSQSPAIRTACKKGAVSFGVVEKEERIGRCDFRLLDEYGTKKIDLDGVLPVRIGIDKWNSTRKPVVCSYTLNVKRTAERLLLKTTEAVDIAVYVDGALVGECDFGTFELTKYFKAGEERALTLVYRKRLWTQDCGKALLLHINGVKPRGIRARTASELCAMGGKGDALALPLKLQKEVALRAHIDVKEECYLKFQGHNVKLTCVMDGRVIGRLILDWTNAPLLTGGDPEKLYLCPAWSGDLYVYAEALGEDACLTGADILASKRA